MLYFFAPKQKLGSGIFVTANIPTAAEVKEKGVAIAEMEAKLLQKVEEMTLYMIEMKKENIEIQKQNDALKARIEGLEKKNKKKANTNE
ncbi:MAG: hypothetical protein NT007_15730 [Candidatus Kapabacteria bacterium]|nr:hypothetical protein [Candidatus Kapabacteria bacterium]